MTMKLSTTIGFSGDPTSEDDRPPQNDRRHMVSVRASRECDERADLAGAGDTNAQRVRLDQLAGTARPL